MLVAAQILAGLAGVALIAAVVLQTTTAEGFSASLGGRETARFQKGSRDELLEKAAKIAAIVWLAACFVVAVIWYHQVR